MTIEKWMGLFMQEIRDYENKMVPASSPAEWVVLKGQLITLIKNVDELNEVYNMENGVKNGK